MSTQASTGTSPRSRVRGDVDGRAREAGPVAQARRVVTSLRTSGMVEPSTADRLGPILLGFARRQHALGRTDLAETSEADVVGFLWARTRRGTVPSISTVHLRRSAIRLLVATLADLGTVLPDPTVAVELPPKTRAGVRPLDDDEMTLLRLAAAGHVRYRDLAEATIALAEATATTGEAAAIVWGQLDLDAGTVQLPGAGRVQPRTAELTAWGLAVLRRRAQTGAADFGAPVVYRGRHDPGSQPSQAAITNRLRRLLRDAGIAGDDVRPVSVRLWDPARRLAAGERIETVAAMLGLTSLDITLAQLHPRSRS